MDPLIQIYIDRLAQSDYSSALQKLEIAKLQKENEELKKELTEIKECQKEGD
jgi:hypothetical protein|nr:MAG TPA: Subunit 21 of Mediator complex [Caudoviricetes sp.]